MFTPILLWLSTNFKKPLIDKYLITLYFNFWIDMLIRSGVIRGALRPCFFMQKWAISDCFWSIKMQRVGLSKILKKPLIEQQNI